MKNRSLAYSLAYFPLCFVVVRRSLGHALYVRSLLRGFHASPTEKYAALIFLSARLSIRRHAVLCVVALPLTYLMYAPRPRSLHALPDNEKIAGSDFSRAKRARRARIRDDTRNMLRSAFLRTRYSTLPQKKKNISARHPRRSLALFSVLGAMLCCATAYDSGVRRTSAAAHAAE